VRPTAPLIADSPPSSAVRRPDDRARGRPEDELITDELIMHLERDQFVAETSRPVTRATLSPRATAALWALRVFVVLVSLMVVYTFIAQLH
jgi:hypothetical protein